MYYTMNRDKNLMLILCNIIAFLLNLKKLLLLLVMIVVMVVVVVVVEVVVEVVVVD